MLARLDLTEVHHLAHDLQTRPDGIETDARTAVQATGYRVVSTAQVEAPFEFGVLRASIGVDFDDDGLGFEAGPTVEYGAYQELGTSEMNPQPYLGPAFDRHAGEVETTLGDVGERILS